MDLAQAVLFTILSRYCGMNIGAVPLREAEVSARHFGLREHNSPIHD